MYELALERDALMQHAAAVEGHSDNVAASLYGSFVICANGSVTVIEAPAGLEAVAVVPQEPVPTNAARAFAHSGILRVYLRLLRPYAATPDRFVQTLE